MYQYKISVIIPVYNVSNYIEVCLQSILEQTLDRFEIIIVNDCTPDDSMIKAQALIEKYSDRKQDIKIIDLVKNEGVAAARKLGFEASEGEYLTCLDSDDYIEKDALELMLKEAEAKNADILICDYFVEFGKVTKIIKQHTSDDVVDMLLRGKLFGGLWNKLFKNSLLDGINYLENISYSEDLLLVFQMVLKTNKIFYLSKPFTHYVQYNNNSASMTFNEKHFNDIMVVYDFMYNYLDKEMQKKYESAFTTAYFYTYLTALKNVDFKQLDKYIAYFDAISISDIQSIHHKLLILFAQRRFKLGLKLMRTAKQYYKRYLTT